MSKNQVRRKKSQAARIENQEGLLNWLVDLHRTRPTTVRVAIDRDATLSGPPDSGYEQKLNTLYGTLISMLSDGYSTAIVELVEHFLRRLEESWKHFEDPSAMPGSLPEKLEELHLKACQLSPPEPKALAARLAQRELESVCGIFTGALPHYLGLLGSEGLAEYRRVVEHSFNALTSLRVGSPLPGPDDGSWRAQHMMERVARASGDLDELAQVMSRNLVAPGRYLQIAMLYRHEGRSEKAAEWAHRGLKIFPQDEPLLMFVGTPSGRELTPEEQLSLLVATRNGRLALEAL